MELPYHLKLIANEIADIARSYGLDFYPVIFELVDFRTMNELASYEGFSVRYPHWRFGMEYERMSKSYQYGLHRIYEMVINNDPAYAYLMTGNSLTDHKLVMAHVYAHVDFFKHNLFFRHTNRKMVDEIANHSARIMRYINRYGIEKVEQFIDMALSLNNLIDYQYPGTDETVIADKREKWEGEDIESKVIRFPTKTYMEKFVNPDQFIELQKEKIAKEIKERKERFPEKPVKDILWFLLQFAPLDLWERDILSIIREEAYYYAPQMQTKIMNEGWASFWHSKMLTEKVLTGSEIVDFADHHSMTVQINPYGLNPYRLGMDLFRDIYDRWNRGQFGKEYEECDNVELKMIWNRNIGEGFRKLFEVRKLYNDVTFIDEFFTPEFAQRHKYYVFGYNKRTGNYEIFTRKFDEIKETLLNQLTNFGEPYITIEDANYKNRGELFLIHRYDGKPLKKSYAMDTMKHIALIWKRPVHLETHVGGKSVTWHHDGNYFSDE